MTIADRIADLSMIWKQASLVFPYFDQRAIDWDTAYKEYLPKVMNAGTDREFHLLLAEFMNLLGDGHTDYQFPRSLRDDTGYLPFMLRFIHGSYCIDATIPEYETYLGQEILSINGHPFSDFVSELKRYSYHVGDYISRYRLHQVLPFFLQPRNNLVETPKGSFSLDLLPSLPQNLMFQTLHLEKRYQPLKTDKLDIRLYDDHILYIRLDDFMYEKAADEIRQALTTTPAITRVLIDLRENVGGMTMYGARVAELFISGEFHGCQKRTRSMTGIGLSSASQILQWSQEAIEKHIAAGYSTREEIEKSRQLATNTHCDHYIDTYGSPEHTALFDGPCVILTTRHTVSAAEDFLAMFRTNHRAAIVGTETCGTTGTPLMQSLCCGGAMRICSVGYRLMDGTEFIGCGIQPDIFCETSVDDFQRGYDHVLQEGLTLITQTTI